MEIRHDPLLLAKIRGFMEDSPECVNEASFEGRPIRMIHVEQRDWQESDGPFHPPSDLYIWFTDNDQVAVATSAHVTGHTLSLESDSTVIVEDVQSQFDVCAPIKTTGGPLKKV